MELASAATPPLDGEAWIMAYYAQTTQQLCVRRIVGSSETAKFYCKSRDTVGALLWAHLLS